MRLTVLLCSLVLTLGTSACLRDSGSGSPDAAGGGGGGGGGGGNHPDGHTAGNPDASMGGNPDAPTSGFPCRNMTSSYGSGHHNPGQDCNGACHDHGFGLAGTLYSAKTGGTAVAGASITVTDASGQTFDMVTQANGNFYTYNTVTFPVTVVASDCPNVQMMSSSVQASSNGGCNKSGCHTTSTTAAGRIHLP